MPIFRAPLADQSFVIAQLAGDADLAALPFMEEVSPDLVTAILAEAGRFASDILAPLDPVGDREGCRLVDGDVITAKGFAAAYGRFVEGGWNGLACAPCWGGQGLPHLLGTAVQEIWHAANMSFALTPMLTQGAIEALEAHGSDALKALYLPKLVSGQWTGTMNLTEPGAGSDVGALKTRAVPAGDGTFRLFGQKIFITAGDHDWTENIVHLVLARLPDAPAGAKGISLFLVPKFLPRADGSPGPRNDVTCIKLEEKLGIHASPTCVMAYGDQAGAVGWLVGSENQGLAAMFTMMNNARLAVGLEGVAVAERALQKAVTYARERVQGAAPGHAAAGPIIDHMDVRRMILDAKAATEASRALAYYAAGRVDVARHHPDPKVRAAAQARVDLLTPLVKAWSTDTGFWVTSQALQVFGGMGFIEETGIARHLRDVRIAAIYEGTNGIQAHDLVGRKLIRDGGRALAALLADIRQTLAEPNRRPDLRDRLAEAVTATEQAAAFILAEHGSDPHLAGAVAAPFLELAAITAGGWLLTRAAQAADRLLGAGRGQPAFLTAKGATASHYGTSQLTRAGGLLARIVTGSGELPGFDPALF